MSAGCQHCGGTGMVVSVADWCASAPSQSGMDIDDCPLCGGTGERVCAECGNPVVTVVAAPGELAEAFAVATDGSTRRLCEMCYRTRGRVGGGS